MKSDSKKVHAITLGACFGVTFGIVANIVIGTSLFGLPPLIAGLLLGAGAGYVFGEKLIRLHDK